MDMSLNLVVGRPGSGKSKYLYDSIIESAKDKSKNHILIVPEQYTLSAQHKVCELSEGHGSFNVDVLSFDRFAYSVFMELGIETGVKLDETGKSIVLRKVIYENKKNLKVYKDKVEMIGFATQLKSIISEFSQYNIDGERFDSMLDETKETPLLNAKLSDISLIIDAYKKEIEGKYITNDDIIHKLSSVIADSKIVKNSYFYFDGFTGFTPIQYELVESIMKNALGCSFTVTLKENEYPVNSYKSSDLFSLSKETIIKLSKIARDNGETEESINAVVLPEKHRYKKDSMISHLEENIFIKGKPIVYKGEVNDEFGLYECDNPKEECEYIARDIVKRIRNDKLRYKDIAVVCSDLESYSRYLTEYFNKYDIPAFIDNKKEILDNPFVDTISALLDIIETGFSFDSVFHYLKRNMTDIKTSEVFLLENYCIANGIKGKKAWTNNFYKKKGGFEDELNKLNDIRRRMVAPIMDVYDVVTDKSSTIKDITKALYNYCVRMNFQEKLHDKYGEFDSKHEGMLSKEYEQVYKIVMDLFDSMVGLLGDEKCGAKKYNDIFSEGLSTIKVGLIPNVHDKVVVGDIERSRVDDIKILYVCGFNEDKVLAGSGDNSIISESDRRFLKDKDFTLAPDDRSRCFINRFYLYTLLALPSERINISWSNVTASGDGVLPSSVISDIKKIFPELRVSSIAQLSKEKIVDIDDIDYIVNEKVAFDILSSICGLKRSSRELDGETKVVYDMIRLALYDSEDKKSLRMIKNGNEFYKHDDTLSADVASALYALRSIIGITGYEKYAKCPYSQFLEIGLGIYDREEYMISSMDIGNLYHDCLEQFCLILNENNVTWKNLEEKQIVDFVEKSAEIVVKKNENMQVFEEDSYAKFRMQRIIKATGSVVRMIKKQIEVSQFTPKYFEYKVDRGRVDRVDVYEEDGRVYFRVIDYKSGANKFDLVKVYNKLQLQLLAYINDTSKRLSATYRDKEIIPVGGYYYHVGEGEYLSKADTFTNGKYDDNKAFEKRLTSNKLSGDTVDDEKCYYITDEVLTDESLAFKDRASKVVAISYTTKGTLSSKSEYISDANFASLREYIEGTMDEMKTDMMAGKNDRSPYCYGKHTGCDYCPYKSICNFNPTFNKKDKYNEIKMSEKDVLDLLGKEGESDEVD